MRVAAVQAGARPPRRHLARRARAALRARSPRDASTRLSPAERERVDRRAPREPRLRVRSLVDAPQGDRRAPLRRRRPRSARASLAPRRRATELAAQRRAARIMPRAVAHVASSSSNDEHVRRRSRHAVPTTSRTPLPGREAARGRGRRRRASLAARRRRGLRLRRRRLGRGGRGRGALARDGGLLASPSSRRGRG